MKYQTTRQLQERLAFLVNSNEIPREHVIWFVDYVIIPRRKELDKLIMWLNINKHYDSDFYED